MNMDSTSTMLTAQKIIIAGQGFYYYPRQLPDGTWCCLEQMAFTTALLVGVSDDAYEFRYCFEDFGRAYKALVMMRSRDAVPEGYAAKEVRNGSMITPRQENPLDSSM